MTLGEGTLIGPYRLGRLLGRGGMAVVYEATHESMGRTVALKLVAPDLTDPGFAQRFRDEGRMQAALEHPHVVPVYEAGTSDFGPYLAMRLVRGTTLAGLIDDGALTSARTLDLLEQVAGALDAAHAAGLVHRDVKPRNVLVEEGDSAYLADFGLTRSGDGDGITATGSFMGTIAYSAPEVVSGETPGPAADRYALAAMLFECLTGTTVFPRPTPTAVLYAHTHEPPPRVSGRREGIPAALDQVLIDGLAKVPEDRPARAADLIARARKALGDVELDPPPPRVLPDADEETTAGQISRPSGTVRRATRRHGRAGLAVAALAGLAVGAAAIALMDGGGSDRAGAAVLPPVLPPAPAGTKAIGSDLKRPGAVQDCAGGRVGLASPGCTIFQDRLAGATLVVQRNGTLRRWAVRSAQGELAITVLRHRDDGYFQVQRSRTEFVPDGRVYAFGTDLPVERGDRVGLVVIDGSGAGLRELAGATTGRFIPALAGLLKTQRPGTGGELLLHADILPGGKPKRPGQVRGAAAARLPAGETLTTKRDRFHDGTPFEIRLVAVAGHGFLDCLVKGRRAGRIAIADLRLPVGLESAIHLYIYPDQPRRVAIDLAFDRPQSARLSRHYLEFDGKRFYYFS